MKQTVIRRSIDLIFIHIGSHYQNNQAHFKLKLLRSLPLITFNVLPGLSIIFKSKQTSTLEIIRFTSICHLGGQFLKSFASSHQLSLDKKAFLHIKIPKYNFQIIIHVQFYSPISNEASIIHFAQLKYIATSAFIFA